MKIEKYVSSQTSGHLFTIKDTIDKIDSIDLLKILPKINQHVGESFIYRYFRDFFSEHPKIKSFSWVQYTPSFNDGDECLFRACFDLEEIQINGISYSDVESFQENYQKNYKKEEDVAILEQEVVEFDNRIKEIEQKTDNISKIILKELNAQKKKIEDTLNKIAIYNLTANLHLKISDLLEKSGIEKIAEQCFGNNVRVTIHSDGHHSTKEYDCGY